MNYRGTIEPRATIYKEMKKFKQETESIVEHRNGDEFPDFVDLLFFFGIKKMLGSVGRPETHI